MGTNCETRPLPDTSNQCCVGLNEYTPEPMPGFCAQPSAAGDSTRNFYCHLMSTAGEWSNPKLTDDECFYNDNNGFQDMGAPGCCNSVCHIVSSKMACARVKYSGDPVSCCFNNFACSNGDINTPCSELLQEGHENLCFSDASKQNTCSDGSNGSPNHRWLASTDCQDALLQYCSGRLETDDPTSIEWFSRWVDAPPNKSCYEAMRKILYSTPNNPCASPPPPPPEGVCNIPLSSEISAEGYYWVRELMNAVFDHYQENGYNIGTLPGFAGYNPFQDYLYDKICCPYNGACSSALESTCSQYSSNRLSLNPTLAQWCGCHLSPDEYEAYSIKYNISPQCTPMCNRAGTIPITGINGDPINCEQNICMIDNFTLNIVNSQVGGGIEFNQVCGSCAGGDCSCIVENTTFDVENSTIGGSFIPVNVGCGSFSCTQTNPGTLGPTVINVPCGSGTVNPYSDIDQQNMEALAKANKNSVIWTLLVVGIALVLIFFVILLLK